MYSEKIKQWLLTQKKKIEQEFSQYGYEPEHLKEVLKQQYINLDKFVEKINTAVLGNHIVAEELFPYFENLSNNRRVAFIFRELTGIATGSTNRDGIKAFIKCFGTAIPNKINMAKKELEKIKEDAIELKKKQKEEADIAYFSHTIWDDKKIEKLTPLQIGRLKLTLEKEWNFNGVIQSLKDNLECLSIDYKYTTNNMHKWSRIKFNRMDGDEQRTYEKKLQNGRTYYISFDEYCRDVSKSIYSVLNLNDETKENDLAA